MKRSLFPAEPLHGELDRLTVQPAHLEERGVAPGWRHRYEKIPGEFEAIAKPLVALLCAQRRGSFTGRSAQRVATTESHDVYYDRRDLPVEQRVDRGRRAASRLRHAAGRA